MFPHLPDQIAFNLDSITIERIVARTMVPVLATVQRSTIEPADVIVGLISIGMEDFARDHL